MNLESLRIFRNVVESGGFSKAVRRSGLSQSAISKQIQALEESLGQRLFDRTTQKVVLTEAGQILLKESQEILGKVAQMRQRLRNLSTAPEQKLRIGVTSSIGISYFPGIFTNFTKNHPHCRLEVRAEFSPALIQAVEARELDCAVVCLPPKLPQNLTTVKTFLDPLLLVASRRYTKKYGPLKQVKDVRTVLEHEPLILIPTKTYTRMIIDHFLFENGIRVEPTMELDSFDLIVSFVSLGLGVSIVPRRVFPVYSRSRSVSCERVGNLNLNRALGIVIREDETENPLLKEFIRLFSF